MGTDLYPHEECNSEAYCSPCKQGDENHCCLCKLLETLEQSCEEQSAGPGLILGSKTEACIVSRQRPDMIQSSNCDTKACQ
jgi:hypothetical protein